MLGILYGYNSILTSTVKGFSENTIMMVYQIGGGLTLGTYSDHLYEGSVRAQVSAVASSLCTWLRTPAHHTLSSGCAGYCSLVLFT